jgi:hypothetical protein
MYRPVVVISQNKKPIINPTKKIIINQYATESKLRLAMSVKITVFMGSPFKWINLHQIFRFHYITITVSVSPLVAPGVSTAADMNLPTG